MSAMTATIHKYMYDPVEYKGKKNRRNFIHENMRHVKKSQRSPVQFSKNQNNKTKSHRRGDEKYIHSSLAGYDKICRYNVPETPQTEVGLRTHKEKACQTLTNARYAYNEGVILYPSERPRTPPPKTGWKDAALQTSLVPKLEIEDIIPPDPSSIGKPGGIPYRDDGKIDFVKLNATVQLKKKNSYEKPDPTKAPPNYQRGVVPKYLREAKKQQLEEMKEKGIAEELEDDERCPPGHVLLSETEKKQHLKKIRNTYAELVSQLNSLPLRSDSLKVRTKRQHIEQNLRKLEDGIKLFSREKLYIKVD